MSVKYVIYLLIFKLSVGDNKIKFGGEDYDGVVFLDLFEQLFYFQSSLNCTGDKTSWSYQLFNIYQQYPDKLLRSVMSKTRADQMVSLRKRYLRTHIRQVQKKLISYKV